MRRLRSWLLKMQPVWLRDWFPQSQLPSQNQSCLYLSTGTEQPKSNYHSGKILFSCIFSYIVINPMTRWWGLVLGPNTWVSELGFPACSFISTTAKEPLIGMTLCLLQPYVGLHCFFFTRIHNSYLFIVMETDNWHWSIMTPLIDSRMTSCNVTFLRE